jgi:hypothetical protein
MSRTAFDALRERDRPVDGARPPAEGDQAIIEERRYRVRSARWADSGRLVWEIEAVPC